MGRPRMDQVREREIVDAFLYCIREKGADATTLEDVAREVGLGRGTMRHFVGNRSDLTRLAVKHLIALYMEEWETRLGSLAGENRVAALLDLLFAEVPEEYAEEARATETLMRVARHQDPEICGYLREIFDTYLQRVLEVLTAAYPAAPHERCLEVAYGLICLTEQTDEFRSLGYFADRSRHAHAAARALLSCLGPAES